MPKSFCLIGVDVGTTNVKAGAYTAEGQVIATASAELTMDRPRPGWATYNPLDIWLRTADVISKVSEKTANRFEPLAVAVASMAETGIPIDKHGLPIYKAIAWFDSRTVEQADWWTSTFGPEFIFARTGLPIQPLFGINKLSWIKKYEAEVFSRVDRWLSVSDYINFCLSGVQASELSLASRTMALDLRKKRWSEEILDAVAISSTILGEPVSAGEVLGHITPKASELTRLPSSVRVVTGGHDHPCAALGSGVFQTGLVLDSLGTSESLLMTIDSPVLDPAAAGSGFAQGCHVLRDRFVCFGGLVTMGAAIDWFRNIVFPEMPREKAYRCLEEQAFESKPGSGGVYFVPYLRAASPPHSESISRGVFVGLKTESSQGDLSRAVLEGLAYCSYDCLKAFQNLFNVQIKQVRAVGGPTRNRLLMQIKSALVNIPFTVLEVEEAACRGAAILAGLGADIYKSIHEVDKTVEFRETPVEPPPRWHEIYRERYNLVYRRIYPNIRDINERILEIENT
jgi:xylulokinase